MFGGGGNGSRGASPLGAEPMVLGSPPRFGAAGGGLSRSPSRQASVDGAAFAPPFFLGGRDPAHHLPVANASPFTPPLLKSRLFEQRELTRGNNADVSRSFSSHQTPLTPANTAGGPKVTWSPELVQSFPPSPNEANKEKAAAARRTNMGGAPPLRSLVGGGGDVSCGNASTLFDQSRRDYSFSDAQLHFLDNSNAQPPLQSTAQADPFYTQGEDFDAETHLDAHWVTVFGFPAESADFVVRQLALVGAVLQIETPSQGNWMHVKFQSPLDAKRALSKNAKILPGHVQIGVTPCIDREVMSGRATQQDGGRLAAAAAVASPTADSCFRSTAPPRPADEWARSTQPQPTKRRVPIGGMRSLTSAFTDSPDTSLASLSMQASDERLVNRAWNYIFG